MKISDVAEALEFKVLTDFEYENRDITGVYIGDLLSWVMGRAQSGNVWITIMSNVNIVAVSSLTDCAFVLLCEGVVPDSEVLNKANMQEVVIMSTQLSSYEAACRLREFLKL